MNRVRAITGLILVTSMFFTVAPLAGAERVRWIVPGGQEARILSLVGPARTQELLSPGAWFDQIDIQDEGIVFSVSGLDPSEAPPLSIVLSWTGTGEEGPPPWQIEIEGPGSSDAVEGAAAFLRSRIEERLTRQVFLSILRPISDSEDGWAGSSAGYHGPGDDSYRRTEVKPRRRTGLFQYDLLAVVHTAPDLPPWWVTVILAILVVVGGGAVLRRVRAGEIDPARARTWWPFMAFPGLVLAGGAAWWFLAPISEAGSIVVDQPGAVLTWMIPALREFAVAQVFFFVALSLTLVGGLASLWWARRAGVARVLMEVGIVGVVSFWVRLGLTAPNLYSRGAGGFERLLRYVPGEGGVGLMSAWILPEQHIGFIWSAMGASTGVAALAAPLLYILGRGLGLSSTASLMAGLALATWPLHAAISASDLLVGPLVTVGIAAWAFGVYAVVRGRALLLLPAAGLLAWAVFCRPDGVLMLLPSVGFLAPSARRWMGRPEFWGAAAWIGLALLCRVLGWPAASGREAWVGASSVSWLLTPGHTMFPWWLVAGVPGILALGRRREIPRAAVLGIAAAALSVLVLRPLLGEVAWIEGLALLMPWAALLCGLGIDELAMRLPEPVMGGALVALASVGILMLPSVHSGYLETRHFAASSDLAFRDAIGRLDPRCGILVSVGLEPGLEDRARRYRLIAWEEHQRDPEGPEGDHVVTSEAYLAPTCDEQRKRPPSMDGRFRRLPCWYGFTETIPGDYIVKKISDKSICQ